MLKHEESVHGENLGSDVIQELSKSMNQGARVRIRGNIEGGMDIEINLPSNMVPTFPEILKLFRKNGTPELPSGG
jgi:hypothetical protein